MVALREARRVIGTGCLLVASAISRRDSPELASVWRPEPTPFDSEDASQLVGEVFDRVQVRPWDARLVTLPDQAAVCDYLTARFVPRDRAVVLAWRVSTPARVIKRGALVIGLTDLEELARQLRNSGAEAVASWKALGVSGCLPPATQGKTGIPRFA